MLKVSPTSRPFLIAIGIALIIALWYMFSGRASLDLSTRELQQNENIQNIQLSKPKTVTVTCKNGEKYEIIFSQGQQNYDNLVFNKCGPEGGTL